MAAKDKGKNGTTTAPGGFQAAVDASAAKDKPRAVQTRLDLGTDVCAVYENLDIQVPVSDDEAALLNAQAAEALAEAEVKQKELESRRETMIKPLEAEIKDLRKEASKAATEAAERKRTVNMRIRVEYHPSTAMKRFLHPETGKAVRVDEAMTAKELENYSMAADPPAEERVNLEPAGDA